MKSAGVLFDRENICDFTVQSINNLLQALQCHALFSIFEPIQGGRRDAKFPGELAISNLPSPTPEKLCKLLVQTRSHPAMVPNEPFRMRNILIDLKVLPVYRYFLGGLIRDWALRNTLCLWL